MHPTLLVLALAGSSTSTLAHPVGQKVTNTSGRSSNYHENAGVLSYVNPLIGTYGTTPNGNGGYVGTFTIFI